MLLLPLPHRHALPKFADLAASRGEVKLANSARALASELRRRVASTWCPDKGWFGRATTASGELLGKDWLSLEPQPWALLCGSWSGCSGVGVGTVC